MRFARWVFGIAGAYGVLSVAPLYFLERTIGRQDPPPITHPMFFYGFVGVTLAWQLVFLAIAKQPVRLRPVMPFAVLEKLSFGVGAILLYGQGRLDFRDAMLGGIDLVLGALFLVSWVRLLKEA
jgi:hypothetical protein